MSLWRREAIERFPELSREIAGAENTTMLWFELLHGLFDPSYEKEPPDRETIARVYNYAYWCLKQRNWGIGTSAVACFFEHLPGDTKMRRDMPRWLSQEDFDMLHFAWEYTTKQPFDEFRREFLENKARIEKEATSRRLVQSAGRGTKE